MTKGRGWYNMRAAEMTEEKKNDLMVIQMRKALDPKRFYKGPDIRGALPKYVQVWCIDDVWFCKWNWMFEGQSLNIVVTLKCDVCKCGRREDKLEFHV